MDNNTHWSKEDLEKKGLVEVSPGVWRPRAISFSGGPQTDVTYLTGEAAQKMAESMAKVPPIVANIPDGNEWLDKIDKKQKPIEGATVGPIVGATILDKKQTHPQKVAAGNFGKKNYVIHKKSKGSKMGNTVIYGEVDPKTGKKKKLFDSKIEVYMKGRLEMFSIPYKMKELFIIHEDFKYMGEKIQPIKMLPDFVIYENDSYEKIIAIVDCKGDDPTADWKIKAKMLKKILAGKGMEVPFLLPNSNAKCDRAIGELKKLLGLWK